MIVWEKKRRRWGRRRRKQRVGSKTSETEIQEEPRKVQRKGGSGGKKERWWWQQRFKETKENRGTEGGGRRRDGRAKKRSNKRRNHTHRDSRRGKMERIRGEEKKRWGRWEGRKQGKEEPGEDEERGSPTLNDGGGDFCWREMTNRTRESSASTTATSELVPAVGLRSFTWILKLFSKNHPEVFVTRKHNKEEKTTAMIPYWG